MRDAIIIVGVLAAAPICLFRPFFGVLMWFVIAIIDPAGYAWGIGARVPAAMIIAVPTLLGGVSAVANVRLLPKQMAWFFLFWAWMAVTYVHATEVPIFADHLQDALQQLDQVSKILLMTVFSILVVATSKKRFRYLLLTTISCLGFLAIKGAVFGLITGGMDRIYGSHGSFIGDNNDFALALNMTMAIPFFMAREEPNRRMRLLLRMLFAAYVVCVILSYSRGGLLGLMVVLTAIALKSRRKAIAGLVVCAILAGMSAFTTEQWKERMNGFLHGKIDLSAEQRLITWGFAWHLANAYPLTGGGFETFTPDLFARFQPEKLGNNKTARGPHSIYFQVLGEHGFVGLILFLALLLSCWRLARRTRRIARGHPDLEWVAGYSHMFEIGLVGYVVSGAFLGRAYFDLYYELLACVVIMNIIVARTIADEKLTAEDQAEAEELREQAMLPAT